MEVLPLEISTLAQNPFSSRRMEKESSAKTEHSKMRNFKTIAQELTQGCTVDPRLTPSG